MSDSEQSKSDWWDKFGWIVIFDVFLLVLLGIVAIGYASNWSGFSVAAGG